MKDYYTMELEELVKRFEIYLNVIKDFVKHDEDWIAVINASNNKSLEEKVSASVGLTYVTEYNIFRQKIDLIRQEIFRVYHSGDTTQEKASIYIYYRKLADEYLNILHDIPNIQVNWGDK